MIFGNTNYLHDGVTAKGAEFDQTQLTVLSSELTLILHAIPPDASSFCLNFSRNVALLLAKLTATIRLQCPY